MKLAISSFVLVLGISIAGPSSVLAGPMGREELAARRGDNTISFHWNASRRKVTEASSSRMISAGQEVELLTSFADRTGMIRMKAVLRNISEDKTFTVDGRLIHRVFRSVDEIKTLRSRPLDAVLRPGERIVARFSYMLKTGDYSARTDLVTK